MGNIAPGLLLAMIVITFGMLISISSYQYALAKLGPIKRLSNETDFSYYVPIVVSGRNVYATWSQFSANDGYQQKDKTLFSVSHDGGQNFKASQLVNDTYVFSWNNVPGRDSDKLEHFLRRFIGVDMAENITFVKENSGKTIRILGMDNASISLDKDPNNAKNATLRIENATRTADVLDEKGFSTNHTVVEKLRPITYHFIVKRDSTDSLVLYRPTTTFNLALSASNKNVYAGWIADDLDYNHHLYFRSSHDNGSNFNREKELSNYNYNFTLENFDIASFGKNVYVVWTVSSDYAQPLFTPNSELVRRATHDVIMRVSHDEGMTFGPKTMLFSENDTELGKPQILAYGNNVYVGWYNNTASFAPDSSSDLQFVSSHDEGKTFGPPIRLGESIDISIGSGQPSMKVYQNNVYAMWLSKGKDPGQIVFRASHDNGSSFSPAVSIGKVNQSSSSTFFQVSPPMMTVSGKNVYVAYSSFLLNKTAPADTFDILGENIFLTISHDNGSSFSPAINMTNIQAGCHSDSPWIDANDRAVSIVWSSRCIDSSTTQLRTSTNEGNSFGPAKNVSDRVSDEFPQVYETGNNDTIITWIHKPAQNGVILYRSYVSCR